MGLLEALEAILKKQVYSDLILIREALLVILARLDGLLDEEDKRLLDRELMKAFSTVPGQLTFDDLNAEKKRGE